MYEENKEIPEKSGLKTSKQIKKETKGKNKIGVAALREISECALRMLVLLCVDARLKHR
jgi:hypothetical protein